MNTYNLLVQIKEHLAKENIEVEIVSLYDLDIKSCLGCERCILQDKCVLKDDAEMLMEKIDAADGIILSSPVYMQQVSGKMKTFIDRTCKWYHRPVLYGKPILAVSTTKGSGLKSTLSYLSNVAVQWGAMPAGSIGRTIRNIDEPVSEKEISYFVKLLQSPQKYSPPLSSLINFEVQKVLTQYLGEIDAKYWNEKGWNTKSYYFPCKINCFKCMISGSVGFIIRRGIGSRKA